jgi:hypothetical protein
MTESYGCPFDITWHIWGLIVLAISVTFFTVVALLSLRRRPLGETPRFLWTILILLWPILGPLAYVLVHPGTLEDKHRRMV